MGQEVRSILGVLLGYTIAGFPPLLFPSPDLTELAARRPMDVYAFVFVLCFLSVSAAAGGAIAASVARRKPLTHAAAVGGLLLVSKLVPSPESWVQIVEGIVFASSALLGMLSQRALESYRKSASPTRSP